MPGDHDEDHDQDQVETDPERESARRQRHASWAWMVFAVVAGVSLAIQVLAPLDLGDRPETTFDTAPRGHAGLFALLERFDATPGRWLTGLTMPPEDATVWWVRPQGVCEESEKAGGEEETEPRAPARSAPMEAPFRITTQPWVEAGGTAVVWLAQPPTGDPRRASEDASNAEAGASTENRDDDPDRHQGETGEERVAEVREEWEQDLAALRSALENGQPQRCRAIAGFALPPRQIAGLEGGAPPAEGRYSPVVFSIGRATPTRETFAYEAARTLPGPTLAFFDSLGASEEIEGWRPLWVDADAFTPLAIERSIGAGRLVVIADARLLSNARLAQGDSAPFVFDVVAAFGRPWLDEHSHGIVEEVGTFRYLARSPAWAAGLGLIVLALLVVWQGHAWPTRSVEEEEPGAPMLTAFVDSVASLYAETRDHGRAFERYRGVCLDRIRRALGFAPGTSGEVIEGSLRDRAADWPALREAGLSHLLTKQIPVETAADFERDVARLDELVEMIRRLGSPSSGPTARRRTTSKD